MAGLLYYVPDRRAIGIDVVKELGLGYAMDRGGPQHAGMQPGPDTGSGVVFSFADPDGKSPSLHAAGGATWEQVPGSPVWIGFDPEDPPRPDDLARAEQRDGHAVRLGDGNDWLVPVARAVDGTSPLPRRLRWDGETWAPGDVLQQYTDLFGEACRIWDTVIAGDADSRTLSVECGIAVMALAINYRLGPAEVSLLGLFDTVNEAEIVLALIDWPAVLAFKKKLDSGEITLPPGDED